MLRSGGMADVSFKKNTKRVARACVFVELGGELVKRIKRGNIEKGNVLECSRVAGILAAKKTSSLIPLCHNIDIDKVSIDFRIFQKGIEVISEVKAFHKTGVEMEALAACAMASLTIYDMCKKYKRDITIKDMYLLEKRGGKSGAYKRQNLFNKHK